MTWGELLSVRTFRKCRIHFISPSQFKNKGTVLRLFPNPISIFSTAAAKWSLFSGNDDFPSGLVYEMTGYVGERKVELHTQKMRGHDGLPRYGVVGHVDYFLEMATPEWERAFSTLSMFLFWAGAGKDTGAGMGQIKVEPEYK